jgi:2'-5' RNA ligase
MSFAISLKAVNDTAEPIRALWDQVSLLEEAPSMVALNYPPHITLAIYDDVAPHLLTAALRRGVTEASALRLTFTRLRFFDSDPLVLWADPSPSPALTEAYAAVHAYIDPAQCHPHYRPGAWTPHCTLGTQIKAEHRADAIALTTRSIEPFDVLFDVVDCVCFPPVAVLEEHVLLGPERANAHAQLRRTRS